MLALVVEDDSRLRQVLSRWLRSNGFDDVAEAGDGQEALGILTTERPSLILTDYEMPRMDGIAFVRELRTRGNKTPVIMLTGRADPHTIVVAAKAGVNNFLPKPILPELLAEKIGQILATPVAL